MANPNIPHQFSQGYPALPLDHRVPDPAMPQSAGYPQEQMMPHTASQALIEPSKYNGVRGNYSYELVIEQQPIRARMCGFGDKDRRPITPPPCVRVIVRDITTGKEIPAKDIDPAFFILSVDLWDEGAQQEKNVVRTSSNTPAVTISTATTTSFPPQPERPQMFQSPAAQAAFFPTQPYQMVSPQGQQSPYPQQNQTMYPQSQNLPPIFSGGNPSPAFPAQDSRFAQSPFSAAATSATSPAYPIPFSAQSQPAISWPQSQNSQGMYTRNLIGSLTVNAFTLKDDHDNLGVWFVLQDLSVRTEAVFRLKMNFIDIGTHPEPVGKQSTENKLNCGKSPILASVFSQPFQVFSAKKFPGVIESTPLSKCFASQGIKIPIRKDGAKGEPRDDDGE